MITDTISGIAPLLEVFDMPTSLRFYRDILSFKVISSSGEGDDVDWVLMKLNNEAELMLNTVFEAIKRPSAPETGRQAAHKDITLYFNCPYIDTLYTYLKKADVQLKEPFINSYNWKAIRVADPDGYA